MNSMAKIDLYCEVTAEELFLSKRNYFWLALQSYLVDALSLSVLISTWYLMDHLTKNELWNSIFNGFEILTQLPNERHDELYFIFPHIAKCAVSTYGVGGNKVPYDVICTLSQNDLFEKIFILEWIFLSLMMSLIILIFGFKTLQLICSLCFSEVVSKNFQN